MIVPRRGTAFRTLLAAALAAAAAGCSDSGSVGAIDQKSALEKAAGDGVGKTRTTPKAKAAMSAEDAAAQKHQKLR